MAYFYVASPYSSPDQTIMHERFLVVERYVANALKHKHFVYSPIVHCHELARRHVLPTDHEFWSYYNFSMITPSAGLEILKMPGWDVSKGVTSEKRFAEAWQIPITYVEADHPWLQEA